MQLNHGLHLAYCTNIHRAETWAQTLRREKCSCRDRKSTRLNSSHVASSYAVFCLEKKQTENKIMPSDRFPHRVQLVAPIRVLRAYQPIVLDKTGAAADSIDLLGVQALNLTLHADL